MAILGEPDGAGIEMSRIGTDELRAWLFKRLRPLAGERYARQIARVVPGVEKVLGVPLPKLREIAGEANRRHKLEPMDWVKYLSVVIPGHGREEIIAGAVGLGKRADTLDDLFGERAGGWARELDNWETTDQLAQTVGWWVLGDISRIGYLEAWAVRGETVWKKRLGVAATVVLNHGDWSHPNETFRVVRHVMTSEEQTLIKAAGWAIREVRDLEAVERFLAWWAPRCRKTLLTEASKKLPEESRARLKELV